MTKTTYDLMKHRIELALVYLNEAIYSDDFWIMQHTKAARILLERELDNLDKVIESKNKYENRVNGR